MRRRKFLQRERMEQDNYYQFGRMVGFVGGAALILSWFFGSILPMVVACVGLYAAASFSGALN